MAKGRVIPISFKNTTEDDFIYEVIQKQRDKSNFVKVCVEYYLLHHETIQKEVKYER